MAAKNQNFEMFAGDTKRVTVTVAGVDLTDATVKWAMRKSMYDAEPAVYKDTTSGIFVTGPLMDTFAISLVPADTSKLSGGYYHEAEITDIAGNVSTILTGKVTIKLSGV